MTMNWRRMLAGPVFALMAVPFASAGEGAAGLPDGLYARIVTNRGEIICKLEFIKTPMTVMNFVGLAEGKLDTTVKKGQPYYDGIVFHRVVPGFVIQGGDPSGNGTGGPGYRFPDEFDASLTHKSEGILSMANAGAGTNGSQFFITLDETPHLDNRHSVFGEVVRGMDVVKKIKVGDKMEKVEIIRVGAEAQAFVPSQEAFDNLKKNQAARAEKMKALAEQGSRVSRAEPNVVADKLAKNAAALKEAGTDADTLKWLAQAVEWAKQSKKSKGGSLYVVLKEGTGDAPRKGQKVAADYTGRLLTGEVFDSSIPRGEPIEFPVGKQNVIAGWDEALSEMKVGEKRALFIPSDQAYGDRGAGGAIPPKAMLFFEVERVK